jgi:hypothetical protein
MWNHGHVVHPRGPGFFWPGLLFVGLFLLVFGKFLFPLLLLGFLVGAFMFCMRRMSHHRSWGHSWGDKPKRSEWYEEEKPKRNYRQTADGEWVEIV